MPSFIVFPLLIELGAFTNIIIPNSRFEQPDLGILYTYN